MPLTQAITRRQNTLQVLSELLLFYRRWKDEEKEWWNPCLSSRCSNFEVQAPNSFSENYSNSNLLSIPSFSPLFLFLFTFFFWKHLICNVVLEFEEKTLKFLLEINRKLSDLARIYEPERSLINTEQLKSKDEFDELNEKLEDPSEKPNLVTK